MSRRNRPSLAAFATFAALLVVGGTRRVWAQATPPLDPPLDLSWHAPDGCPGPDRVLEQVRQLLERDGVRPQGARLRAQVEIEQRARGMWRMLLVTSRGSVSGRRTLEGASCQEVADAVTVILTLTLDPAALSTPALVPAPEPTVEHAAAPVTTPALVPALAPAPEPTAAQTAAPAPVSAPTLVPAPEPIVEHAAAPVPVRAPPVPQARPRRPRPPEAPPPRPPSPSPRAVLGAGLAVDFGALPTLAPGAAITGGLRWRTARVEGFAAAFPWSQGTSATTPPGGGEFFLVFGGLAACAVAPLGPVELGGCGGIEAGVLHGHGTHVHQPFETAEPWLALAPSARLLVPLGPRFAVRLDVGPVFPLVRPRFYFDPMNRTSASAGDVYQPAPVTFRALLGGELRF